MPRPTSVTAIDLMVSLPLREHVWAPFRRDNAVAVYGLADMIG